MQQFTTAIKKFDEKGEKTGWSYVEIPAAIADKIKAGYRKSFRVKGKIDDYAIEKTSIIPMGGGSFILPLKSEVRKAIGKNKGAMVTLQLSEDKRELVILPELIECLEDEPVALANFQKLPPSHQRYFDNWIQSAKTDATRAKRIALTVKAMLLNMNFGEMIREEKARSDWKDKR